MATTIGGASRLVFLAGLLVFPVLFGSFSGAICLLISLFWLIYYGRRSGVWFDTPLSIKIWVIAALGFFPLYAVSMNKPQDLMFAFNQFAFLLAVGVYWSAKDKFRRSQIEWFAFTAFIGLLFGAIWAIHQFHFADADRVSAVIGGGPNLIARVAVLLFLFSAVPLWTSQNNWLSVALAFGSLILTCLIVFYSGSRGTLLTVPFVLTMVALATLKGNRLFSIKTMFLSVIVLCMVTLVLLLFDLNGQFATGISRVLSIWDVNRMDGSTFIRFEMWKIALSGFENSPVFGNGWHSFRDLAQNSPISYLAQGTGEFNLHADLANFAAAGGVIGIILYFTFLCAPIIEFHNKNTLKQNVDRVVRIWSALLPACILLLGLTDMVIGFDLLTMLYAFSYALIRGIFDGNMES